MESKLDAFHENAKSVSVATASLLGRWAFIKDRSREGASLKEKAATSSNLTNLSAENFGKRKAGRFEYLNDYHFQPKNFSVKSHPLK